MVLVAAAEERLLLIVVGASKVVGNAGAVERGTLGRVDEALLGLAAAVDVRLAVDGASLPAAAAAEERLLLK